MDKTTQSIKLWYSTNLLTGAYWAGSLFIAQKGNFSFEPVWIAFFITFFGAAASAIAILCALPLFDYALALAKIPRLITAGLIVLGLWALSTAIAILLLTHTLWGIYSFLPATLPSLGTAYLATVYVYRAWLFRP